MKCLSFAFLAIMYIVFTNTNCDIKWDHFGNENRTKSINSVLRNLVNKTNLTVVPFLPNVAEEDSNFHIDIEDTLLSNEERGKICLKNVTECMEKDTEYKVTTSLFSSLLFSSLPPFDLSGVVGVSRKCHLQSKRYIADLRNFKLWALKMYDSTAKLPSGILNGNVNQFGDFDMCLSANLPSKHIFGQYCLVSLEIETPPSPYLAGLHKLMQSHYHFRSKLEDPGHRVPRFSSINWALCVPNACSTKDVELGLKKTMDNLIKNTELKVRYEVDPAMCQRPTQTDMPLSTYIGISFFVATILGELFATAYDYLACEEKSKWIVAFSLKKNLKSLTTIKRSSDDIEAVHGIRSLNAILLLLAHKSMALFFLPFANRTEFVEYISRPFSVLGRAASLYTDPFIMISATLTTYSLLGKLNRNKEINIIQEYISRLFRIVPSFAAVIIFCTFVLPWIDSGPLWNLVVTHHSTICKKYWWRNLLFIHNYFGFKDMCLTHTHHVGIDTQLFFISPFLILMIWKWPKNGTIILITLASISTFMRYYVTYSMRLSNYVHFGTSVQQLFETADNMYILPVHRATVYIMGIFLGYILRSFRHIQLTKTRIRFGNTIALFSFIISYFGPSFMSSIDYVYDPTDAAWYAAISPILWCISFCWIIFTVQAGYRGLVGSFLSAPIFRFWTKISYTVYLTQFPIYFYNVGVTRSSENASFFRMILNLKEYFWVVLLSVVLTLTFELPFQNIRNNLIKGKHKQEDRNYDLTKEKKHS
ncbi:nose resistant to fluoxetine protein 6-like [Anoplophora glabripennis]|uniref:nose resistant to fluoxetine protein 6-like n=1 Tax=Anoplophora glabripennis TaxID=217634 RepID=UPI00087382B8|nr:nose resistant to fluoxetine protein 6-like [Anoplophora glabripennis]